MMAPKRFVQRVSLVLLAACSLASAGCGEAYQVAPVSGTVTLDGKPLPGVVVTFQPAIEQNQRAIGPASSATTGPDGRYTLHLVTVDRKPGAVVGKHTVRIMKPRPSSEEIEAKGVAGSAFEDPVPAKYQKGVDAEVPAEGTEKADFAMNST